MSPVDHPFWYFHWDPGGCFLVWTLVLTAIGVCYHRQGEDGKTSFAIVIGGGLITLR